jgi:hypothetical protein
MSQAPIVLQVNTQSPPSEVNRLPVSHTRNSALYVPGGTGNYAKGVPKAFQGDIDVAYVPTLELANGHRVNPSVGKSLFKQQTSYLRRWASIQLEPVVKRGVSVHSKLTQGMFRRMCQGEATPEEILEEYRGKTPAGKRTVHIDLVNDSSLCSEVLVTGTPAATAPPVLLQLVILQEASLVLAAWKLGRGEGGMREELTSAMGDALAEKDEGTYVYGDMITFPKMLKDSALVRMVVQRVAEMCVVWFGCHYHLLVL